MLDSFIWWGTHCPVWQLYASVEVAGLVLVLILAPGMIRTFGPREKTIENTEPEHYDCNQLNSSVMPGDIIEPTEVAYG